MWARRAEDVPRFHAGRAFVVAVLLSREVKPSAASRDGGKSGESRSREWGVTTECESGVASVRRSLSYELHAMRMRRRCS